MKKFLQCFCVFFIGILVVAIGSPPAFAQEKKAEFTLEEIIVTAERRETSIMDTPLAVTALTSDSLDQQNITGTFEILMQAPGAAYWGGNIYIRGVGNALLDMQSDPAVGIFYDGAYNEYTTRLNQMVDVERVEIVRGPQSTMYGKNTIAGAVNVIFAKPTKEFEGQLKARIGNYNFREFTGIINVPLVGDWLLSRASYLDHYYGGHVKALALNTYSGVEDDWKADLKLLCQPTDNFSTYFQYKIIYTTGNSGNGETSTLADDVTSPLNTSANQWNALYGTPQNPNLGSQLLHITQANQLGFTVLDSKEVSLATDLSAGNFSFRHHMYYRWFRQYGISDSDDGPSWDALYVGDLQYDSHEWAQDLQLMYGGADTRINLLGGIFYYFADTFGRIKTYRDGPAYWEFSYPHNWSYPAASAAAVPGLTEAFNRVAGLTGFTPRFTNGRAESYFHSTALESTSQSAYLNVSFDAIKDKLTLSMGGRYTIDEKDTTEDGEIALVSSYGTTWTILSDAYRDQNGITDTLATAGLDPVNNPEDVYPAHALGYYIRRPPVWTKFPYTEVMPVSIKQDWDALTWKAGADYRFSADDMVYVNVSRGYKPGGLAISDSTGQKSSYDSEYLMSYEGGWKSQWLDNKLQTTVSAFFNDYTDKQQNFYIIAIDPISGEEELESLVTNAGKMESYGLEFEGAAFVTKQLRVSWQYSYLHSEYKEFTAYDPVTEKNEDVAGRRLPIAPEHKINLQGSYTYPTDIGDFVFRAAYSWQDKMTSNFFGYWYSWTKPWDRVDAELMWFSPDYKWRVTLWGKNIMDHRTATFVTGSVDTDQPEPKDIYLLTTRDEYYMDPFTFGVEVSYKW